MSMTSGDSFLRRHEVLAYFCLTVFISWAGAFAVVARSFIHQQPVSKTLGLIIFPVMLLGPSVSGILMTWLIDGRAGLRDLAKRLSRWRVGLRWYALLLLPPALILFVLSCFKVAVAPGFSPNHFYLGILFGIPAGLLEEIGWTGYAYPRMVSKWKPFSAALLLGLLWSLWHLPAINFLGASAPHSPYWFRFFVAFAFAMTAMRVLISWLYSNTKSLMLAQFMHINSTGSLVVFSPSVAPPQEALWYAVYGCLLWIVVAVILVRRGPQLGVKPIAVSVEHHPNHNLQISNSRS